MMWDGYGSAWMGGMWVLGLLVVIVVVLQVVTLVRVTSSQVSGGQVSRRAAGLGSTGNARAIIEERYARGEIDTADYEERLRNLERP